MLLCVFSLVLNLHYFKIQVDLQLESGEYFLSAEMKAAKKWEAKKEKQSEKAVENKRKREAAFIAPKVVELHPYEFLFFCVE